MSWTKVQGYVVILLSLLCISSTTAATLFPFGDSAGDLELTEIGNDEYYTVVFSKLNFPFDGVRRNYITVSIIYLFLPRAEEQMSHVMRNCVFAY